MRGTVREWDEELGWGVLDADEMPETIWAHDEGLALKAGDRVDFDLREPADETGFRFGAVRIRALSKDGP